VGLPDGLLLALDVVVVVQQVAVAGAVAAVAGVEHPRLVLVVGQHAHPSPVWDRGCLPPRPGRPRPRGPTPPAGAGAWSASSSPPGVGSRLPAAETWPTALGRPHAAARRFAPGRPRHRRRSDPSQLPWSSVSGSTL